MKGVSRGVQAQSLRGRGTERRLDVHFDLENDAKRQDGGIWQHVRDRRIKEGKTN